jgi:hypothetical protein
MVASRSAGQGFVLCQEPEPELADKTQSFALLKIKLSSRHNTQTMDCSFGLLMFMQISSEGSSSEGGEVKLDLITDAVQKSLDRPQRLYLPETHYMLKSIFLAHFTSSSYGLRVYQQGNSRHDSFEYVASVHPH